MLTTIGCFEQTKKVTSAAESMKKNRVVRIITDAVNAPFEFGKDTGVQGLDVDIGNEIGKTLGIEVKWVKVSGYEHLFELLKNGDAEILISSIAIDSKKAAEFSFSTPYYDSGDGIAVQHGKLDINDPASLSAKKVGVATERPGDAFMSLQKAVSVKKYDTLDDAMGGLNRAEIDAVVGDEPFIAYGSVKSFLNTMLLPTMINKYQYAVVIRKSEPDLLATINETINRLKTSGDLKKLDEKWMGNARAEAAKRHNKVVKMHNDEIELRRAENAPKTISVNIIKLSGSWDMSRLDGFELVLKGASETFQSTPIETTGNKGNCKFIRQVPPGDYMLNLNILKMEAKVSVPALAKPSLTMDMKIAQELTIQFK
jgi:ABC-type amino acid transport substrate-binding protein